MKILYIEPYLAGSHAAFTRTLTEGLSDLRWTQLTLPGRHWKWRMRGTAPWLALEHAETLAQPFDLLLASSYLALAELRGLVPELTQVPALLYFHENQLTYPVRIQNTKRERDTHFGFTQLVSALAADGIAFNSEHNRSAFYTAARALLRKLPDAVPKGWVDRLEARSRVLHVPLELPERVLVPDAPDPRGPVVLWNHRWEHDKNPEAFFAALFALEERGVPFRVIVCGQRFRKAPPIFAQARERLASRIEHWGYAKSREAYYALLNRAHIAVSTANHEFFGISMLEATHFGAYPLVPDRLAYPELFPQDHRYTDDAELVDRLTSLAQRWCAGEVTLRADREAIVAPVRRAVMLPRYRSWLEETVASSQAKKATRLD